MRIRLLRSLMYGILRSGSLLYRSLLYRSLLYRSLLCRIRLCRVRRLPVNLRLRLRLIRRYGSLLRLSVYRLLRRVIGLLGVILHDKISF